MDKYLYKNKIKTTSKGYGFSKAVKNLFIKNKKFITIFNLLWILVSCNVMPEKKNPEKKSYLISADRNVFTKGKEKFDYLKVNKFKISSFYEGKGFIYKNSDVNVESDFYNEFLTFPVSNFQEIFQSWISDTGIGKLAPGVVAEEKLYYLGGHILSLYGDYSDPKKSKAILDIDIYFQKASDSTIVFKKTYKKNISIPKANPEELVKGWNVASTEILQELEKDIRKVVLTSN